MIPQSTMDGLIRYRDHGVPTGDFLQAVLSNDLMAALSSADDNNRAAILEICQFIYNDMPSRCHGSREKYEAWVEKHFAAAPSS
ncbi:MAG: hypothetical protein ACREA9_17505 [Pyrinomonadaceae bacterium]